MGGSCGDNAKAGELGELDAEDAGGGAAAVDEDILGGLAGLVGERKTEGAVQTLALYGSDTVSLRW